MKPPASTSNYVSNKPILPAGPYPAIIVGLYGLGTVEKHYQGKDPKDVYEVAFTFELPGIRYEFTEGAGLQPMHLTSTFPFSLFGQSNLGKLVTSLIGRPLTKEEVDSYDIGGLLGKTIMANVTQAPNAKNPDRPYNNINTGIVLTDQVRAMYNVEWDKIVSSVPFLGISACPEDFVKPSFGEVPNWLRKRMLESHEAKEFINAGGVVYTKPEKQQQQAAPVQTFAPTAAAATEPVGGSPITTDAEAKPAPDGGMGMIDPDTLMGGK